MNAILAGFLVLALAGPPQETEIKLPEILTRVELSTPQLEVEKAITYLEKVDAEDQYYIKFLSLYAVPEELREDYALALSFAVHSLTGKSDDPNIGNSGAYYPLAFKTPEGKFIPRQRVPGSKTLYWLDIRDYNWTNESWEKAAVQDGYFAEPIVQHPTSSALRLKAGNAVLRGDWFLRHTLDTTRQEDNDRKDILYYEFLYSLSKIPKTDEEFRLNWALDLKEAQRRGNEYAILTSNNGKIVNRVSQRVLLYYRTEYAFLYETFDCKNNVGKRNYIENFFRQKVIGGRPDFRDAGEIIGTNQLQLMTYFLVNSDGNRVNFGDPTTVRNLTDHLGDVRVRTGTSCISCHSGGIIPAPNIVNEFLEDGAKYITYDKTDQNRLKRAFLSEKFEQSVKDSSEIYKRAILKVNGLTPEENATVYNRCVIWYEKPIDLEQAAFECGVPQELYKEKVLSYQNRYGTMLKMMIEAENLIPRDFWEAPSTDGIPGAYQQSMIAINGLTKITEEYNLVENKKVIYKSGIILANCYVLSGKNRIGSLPKGQSVFLTGKKENGYTQIKYKNGTGWVKNDEIRPNS